VLQIRNDYLQFLVFDKKIKELDLLLIGNASGVFSLNIVFFNIIMQDGVIHRKFYCKGYNTPQDLDKDIWCMIAC